MAGLCDALQMPPDPQLAKSPCRMQCCHWPWMGLHSRERWFRTVACGERLLVGGPLSAAEQGAGEGGRQKCSVWES